jgi:hypothetical protein
MRPTRLLSSLLAAAALLVAAGAAAEQRTLLTPDGTLYWIQSGYYATLVPGGRDAKPDDYVIVWSSVSQSGATLSGIIPGTATTDLKDQFDLAYDAYSQALFLVWNNRSTFINSVQFAILQSGLWTQSQLIPSGVFAFTSNPKILITHQTVQRLDAQGNEVDSLRSIVSVIWWEDSVHPRARYAPIFIESDGIALADVQVYDLPTLVGSPAADSSAQFEQAIYQNPALQSDGISPVVLATFADAGTGNLTTVHIGFPSDLRHPINLRTPGGRGHVIIVFGFDQRALPTSAPANPVQLGTVVGGRYLPTVYWQRDDTAVQYTGFDGQAWGAAHTLSLSPSLSADQAITLIRAMASQN